MSVFAPNGNLTTTLTGLEEPFDLAFDAHGNLFVAKRVQRNWHHGERLRAGRLPPSPSHRA